MNKVYCYCYRYPLLRLSISQTAVSAEPASSTGKPIPGCTDRLCHTILILNIIVGSLLTPGTSACHVTRCLCHQGITKGHVQSTDTTDATSARHRRSQIGAACHGSYVSLCPSSVLTTSACAHHRFHPLQNTFLSSFLNVSVLTSRLIRLICGDFPKLQCSFGFGSSSLSVVPLAVTVSDDCHVSRSDGKC